MHWIRLWKHWEMRRYTGLESASIGPVDKNWGKIPGYRRIFMGCMTWKLPGK